MKIDYFKMKIDNFDNKFKNFLVKSKSTQKRLISLMNVIRI